MGLIAAMTVWVVVVGAVGSSVIRRRVSSGVSPFVGFLAMGVVFGSLPWIIELTSGRQPNLLAATIGSMALFVSSGGMTFVWLRSQFPKA